MEEELLKTQIAVFVMGLAILFMVVTQVVTTVRLSRLWSEVCELRERLSLVEEETLTSNPLDEM